MFATLASLEADRLFAPSESDSIDSMIPNRESWKQSVLLACTNYSIGYGLMPPLALLSQY